MIPSDPLDMLVVGVGALWLAVSLFIVIDRLLHDARERRLAEIRRQLMLTDSAHRTGTTISETARRLTPTEFEQLAVAGLPEHVEMAVAREVRARYGAERLRRLADGSDGDDLWRQITAMELLVAGGGGDVYRILDRALRSGRSPLAAAAGRLLVRIGDARAADVLARALGDGIRSRSRIAAALERIPAAQFQLAPLFTHPDAPVRFWAARLAGRFGARRWVSTVRVLVDDPDALVRRAAVEALGIIGDRSDRPLLLSRLTDVTPIVRLHAARAITRFVDTSAAEVLVTLLTDSEWIVRAAARATLKQVALIARPALVKALWHTDTFAANNAAEILYDSGIIHQVTERFLADRSQARELRPVIQRFFDVAGPHLSGALLNAFSENDRDSLLAETGRGRAA